MTELVGDIAIVTGGASGIGTAIATRLADLGASVAIFDLDLDRAETVAKDLQSSRGSIRAIAVQVDITDEQQVEAGFERVLDKLGDPRILMNNAGSAHLNLITEISAEEWDKTLSTNLKGTFLMTRAFARNLIGKNLGGAIVNTSSLNYSAATDGLSHYCCAKAGVSMFTQVAASEFGRHNIRVNAVAPGTTRTPLTEAIGTVTGQMGASFVERTPLGRLGVPEDIALVAGFLATTDARWVTGETIYVDGGNHIRGLHSYWDVMRNEGKV